MFLIFTVLPSLAIVPPSSQIKTHTERKTGHTMEPESKRCKPRGGSHGVVIVCSVCWHVTNRWLPCVRSHLQEKSLRIKRECVAKGPSGLRDEAFHWRSAKQVSALFPCFLYWRRARRSMRIPTWPRAPQPTGHSPGTGLTVLPGRQPRVACF